jgi:hypothetical protein
MPIYGNGKITTNAILYNRGVPPTQQNFVLLASLNYSALRLVAIHNRRTGRPIHTLF